jgi:hypothetical protein
MPRSCLWTSAGVSRENIEITVTKIGGGVHVTYSFSEATAVSVDSFPPRFKVELIDKSPLIFGTSETPADHELTERLAYITAPWNGVDEKYDVPWHILLGAQPWGSGGYGEISAHACPF